MQLALFICISCVKRKHGLVQTQALVDKCYIRHFKGLPAKADICRAIPDQSNKKGTLKGPSTQSYLKGLTSGHFLCFFCWLKQYAVYVDRLSYICRSSINEKKLYFIILNCSLILIKLWAHEFTFVYKIRQQLLHEILGNVENSLLRCPSGHY